MDLRGNRRGPTMFSLSRNLKVALAAAGVALTAISTPVSADEIVQSLGPVQAHQPILITVGNQHVIAFFVPGDGRCNVRTVIWSAEGGEGKSAGIQVSLSPGQTASIDGSATESLRLQCGDNAETLVVLDQK